MHLLLFYFEIFELKFRRLIHKLHCYFQDIKKAISNVESLIIHNHCLQFRIKIRNPISQSGSYANGNVNINNNETDVSEAVIDDGMVLSDLFNKLYNLAVGRGITYTVTECLLDQVSIIQRDDFIDLKINTY